MINNYISYPGPTGQIYEFFCDEKPAHIPPPGGAVWRRPVGRAWKAVPQIVGDYNTAPVYDVTDE